MGFIKAGADAIRSNLQDQWKDLIACENMPNDLLMMKRTTETGIITKGSVIRVMPSQCAVICQNGRILDIIDEEGDYILDESASPSIFAGQFKETFKDIWERFQFNGAPADQQEVYFFNIKEIIDNKFGTVTPVMYKDWSYVLPNKLTGKMLPILIRVKCHGNYTFKIENPMLFLEKISGTAEYYQRKQITEQIKSEVLETLQNVLNELGTEKYKIPVMELPSQTDKIKSLIREKNFDEKIKERGIKITGLVIESISIDEKSEESINEYILSVNTDMREGKIAAAYAEALKEAAKNPNGAMNGFVGMGMLNMNMGNNAIHEVLGKDDSIICKNCNAVLSKDSKFCNKCGAKVD